MEEKVSQTGRITKIEQQKRAKHRYNIYIEGHYSFAVHEDVLITCRLLKDKVIEVTEVKYILEEEEKKKIETAGLHYLSFRPRTIMEMNRHLRQKEFSQDLMDILIAQWIEKGYLDDYKFAQMWVEERLRTKKKGKYLLREELKQKGIETNIIDQAISEMNQEEEYDACLEVARKKLKTLEGMETFKIKQKLYQYLSRRGFSMDLIQPIFHSLIEGDRD